MVYKDVPHGRIICAFEKVQGLYAFFVDLIWPVESLRAHLVNSGGHEVAERWRHGTKGLSR